MNLEVVGVGGYHYASIYLTVNNGFFTQEGHTVLRQSSLERRHWDCITACQEALRLTMSR